MPNDLESAKQDLGATIAEQVMFPMSARNAGISSLLEQAREDSFSWKAARRDNEFQITKSVGGTDLESNTMKTSAQAAQIGINFNSDVLNLSASVNILTIDKGNNPVSTDVFKANVSVVMDPSKGVLDGKPKNVTLNIDEVVSSSSKGLLFAQTAECNLPIDGDWMDVSKDKVNCKGTVTDPHSQEYQFTTEANMLGSKTVVTNGDKPVGVVTTTLVEDDAGKHYDVKVKPGADDGK